MDWKRKGSWIYRGSLVGLTLYILFCWVQHHQAIKLIKTFAKNLNEEIIQVASMPQPISPFRWANYVETKNKVYQGLVDLCKKQRNRPDSKPSEPLSDFSSSLKKLNSLYQPPGEVHYQSWQKLLDSPWVRKAIDTDGVKFYYWFARFPVAQLVNSKDGRHRVEFMDVRFLLPGIRMPFVYYVEFDDSGKIQSEGFVKER